MQTRKVILDDNAYTKANINTQFLIENRGHPVRYSVGDSKPLPDTSDFGMLKTGEVLCSGLVTGTVWIKGGVGKSVVVTE